MSEDDRGQFEGVDEAIDRVREELDEAVEGTRAAGTKASREVREAIDELEERLTSLRRRQQDEE